MNKELIKILTCIRIWSFKLDESCGSNYFYEDIPCIDVNCTECPLFRNKSTSMYANKLVKVFSL